MISPASACRRIRRVVQILRPSLNNVVKSRTVGKDEKPSTDGVYRLIIMITNETARFMEINRSTNGVGIGRIIRAITAITAPTSIRSACLVTSPTDVLAELMNDIGYPYILSYRLFFSTVDFFFYLFYKFRGFCLPVKHKQRSGL